MFKKGDMVEGTSDNDSFWFTKGKVYQILRKNGSRYNVKCLKHPNPINTMTTVDVKLANKNLFLVSPLQAILYYEKK